MLAFKVEDMSCGHCVGAITKAVAELDPAAKVECDLATHQVSIHAASASAQQFQAAIEEAGYSPVAIAGAGCGGAGKAGGCCCH